VVRRAGVGVRVGVVVTGTVDWVEDAFSSSVETVAEGVVLSVVVVISHITLVLLGGVNSGTSSLFYSNLAGWVTAVDEVNVTTLGRVAVVLGREGCLGVGGGLFVIGGGVEVGVTLLGSETRGDGTSTFTELAFRNVDLGGSGRLGGWAVDRIELSVVGCVLNV
jgi:hypothetical protein